MSSITTQKYFVSGDFVYWEAVYNDGTSLREKEGGRYHAIERNKLEKFRIVTPDETILFETWPPVGLDGHHLVYRRRIGLTYGDGLGTTRSALIIIGWLPNGPAWAIDVDNGTYLESPDGFKFGDPIFYPVDPMPGEKHFEDQFNTLNKEYNHLKEN